MRQPLQPTVPLAERGLVTAQIPRNDARTVAKLALRRYRKAKLCISPLLLIVAGVAMELKTLRDVRDQQHAEPTARRNVLASVLALNLPRHISWKRREMNAVRVKHKATLPIFTLRRATCRQRRNATDNRMRSPGAWTALRLRSAPGGLQGQSGRRCRP
mmetsp:Transcript_63079/g.190406  ORF Transcript_63079/g.190406 Transcript_63079/m.190406 type:complete len:159 (+) Transcript_63079:742-1218(+)